MLRALTTRLRRRIGTELRADGGVRTATPGTAQSPGIPPDDPTCDGDCGGRTTTVAVSDLVESEDMQVWSLGTELQQRDIEMVSRCTECGGVHGEFAL